MTIVTVHTAKTQLSKLIARVEAGEEVIIARRASCPDRACQAEAPVRVDEGQSLGRPGVL